MTLAQPDEIDDMIAEDAMVQLVFRFFVAWKSETAGAVHVMVHLLLDLDETHVSHQTLGERVRDLAVGK